MSSRHAKGLSNSFFLGVGVVGEGEDGLKKEEDGGGEGGGGGMVGTWRWTRWLPPATSEGVLAASCWGVKREGSLAIAWHLVPCHCHLPEGLLHPWVKL